MAILFDLNRRIFTLNTRNTTYQMKTDEHGYLLHVYYGTRVHGSMDYLITYADRGFSGNPYVAGGDRSYSLDALPQEYPSIGTGDYRNCALNIQNTDGTECCCLTYVNHEIKNGKYSLKGLPSVWAEDDEAQTLEILLRDEVSGVEVRLLYGVLEHEDIITRAVVIKNGGKETVSIKKVQSACLDFVNGDFDVIKFYGKHAMERCVDRTSLGHGTQSFGSRRGTSSHQYNPGIIIAGRDATEDFGSCYGMLFMYSGNFLCEAERDQYNQTRVLMGLNEELFAYPLRSGECFTAPEVILSYSSQGLGKLSQQYHDCIRNHVCRGRYAHAKRPIIINSWEAAYFDFTGDMIVELAKQAAELGIDMVVMDDGWFGMRNDDNSSLGDWFVNEQKLGGTLTQLIERVNAQGVRFGIWIEPEMVSEDSELYRKHPDWTVTIDGREPIRSRNQLVLDFSRAEVRNEIFDRICAVLDQGNIEYVKWDMNRSISDVYASHVTYDYVIGLYDFLDRLTAQYPQILIEGCSGGGGRFDAAMMYYTPQIWCSDNTDAINRTRIQYGTSFFYPVSVVGSHVSAVPNHQTGRVTNLHTRGVTAMTGSFGYELNPALLSDEEKAEVREQLAAYRKNEMLIREGAYYRLSNPFSDDMAAWMFLSEEGQVLVSVVRLYVEANPAASYLKLKGLRPEAFYLEENSGAVYSGAALMAAGIVIPAAKQEYASWQLEFREMREAAELYEAIRRQTGKGTDGKTVISLYGCSGSGKTTMASALQQYFLGEGICCCVVSGDNYPRRIPKQNDDERMRIYRERGADGLREYLGTPQEIEFEKINQVISEFKAGNSLVEIKKMGRQEGEISFEKADMSDVTVMIIEWTHGGSNYLRGVDCPVYIESTPQETKQRRIKRGRDENAANDFISMVVDIEQEKLVLQSKNAKIILGRDGKIYEQQTDVQRIS